VDATSGKPVEGAPPLEEEMHACTWLGCTRVFPTLLACRGHISSHKQGRSKASEAATEAGTGCPEQQESQNAASRGGEESREKVPDSHVLRLIVVCFRRSVNLKHKHVFSDATAVLCVAPPLSYCTTKKDYQAMHTECGELRMDSKQDPAGQKRLKPLSCSTTPLSIKTGSKSKQSSVESSPSLSCRL
jgi:hypothetical protein